MGANSLPETLNDEELVHSSLDFPVVGIGSSAGGVEALLKFFEHMPSGTGMAFVVIVHLSPKHVSGLHGVIQGVTEMKVVEVLETTRIEPDVVYVIPPTKHLSMNDNDLRVSDIQKQGARPAAIDLFFRTLALVHRERAVGIVLSGTGSDGAVGIARIKEQGGVTLAQSPADAQFDGMPRAAIATRQIDWVVPVVDMPQRLLSMWDNARHIELPHTDDETLRAEAPSTPAAVREAEEALREIMVMLRARTGHDFRHYKRATVLRRLERRLQVNGLPNLPSYRAFLHAQPEEAAGLLKDLLIGVTHFFRDREAFDALEHLVLPELMRNMGLNRPTVRAWVPGCATGEEAYSIAMLLSEAAQARAIPPEIQVFASDIDEPAIAMAREGAYPGSIVADVPPHRLRHFFTNEGHHYRVRKEVRERVLFAMHNLLRDPPFSQLDLITCRNLLIYLDREVHPEVLEIFHFALKPGGFLFLGSSESADSASNLFSLVDKRHRIYRANPTSRASRYVPTLPLSTAEHAASGAPALELPTLVRKGSFAELHQRLLEHHAPPSVLVDAEGNIVHLSERVGRFLRQPGGLPSHQLPALVDPELRLELRTVLRQALQTRESVESRRVHVEREGKTYVVRLTVRPVAEAGSEPSLLLVLFHELEDTMAADVKTQADAGRDPALVYLEDELARTKEQLQNTIEQYEISTEELKAINEELQVINEELRSTTEELETSKEELRSINEEFITVNHELKMKVEETGKINDDLQNLIASTDIATVFIDRGMCIKRYTPRATQIFSLIPTDVGRSLLDITHKLDYDTLADDAGEAFSSLRMIQREVQSNDGTWYLARVLPYRTTEDRIDGAVLTFIDITGRRRAEERLRMVAESTRDYAIVTFDVRGHINTWNRGAERLYGFGEGEAVGMSIERLFTPDDVERGVPAAEMRQAREEGRSEDERWHQRKDGTRFYCSGVTTPLFHDDKLQGYGKIARDLTRAESEREENQRQAAAERAEAHAAIELKDEFLAVMSHELKNPLNLIQLNAELLRRLPEGKNTPVVVRAAETIRRTVLGQAQIIDDLLDLSRMNTGKLALNPMTVDWTSAVKGIVSAVKPEAEAKGVTLEATLGEHVLLHADPVRVEQVVWNLLSNALKFTPSSGWVRVRLSSEGDYGKLQVQDSGKGIPAEFRPRLFEMFQQVEGYSARKDGGLGIGLALVRHIVHLHEGRIEVQSEGAGKGSCFTVWLPLLSHARDLAEDDGAKTLPKGLRVLIVDDELQTVNMLRDLLSLEGVEVTAAHSGEQALAAVDRHEFDIIASDIVMPGMDGYQLIEALRKHPKAATKAIIAITGLGRAADIKRVRAAGYDAHLSKPITLDKLTALFARLAARK